MAEILAVVASGIAVVDIAGKVGGKVLTLKRLWDEVKDVPDTINNLMRQIDIINPILDEMDSGFHRSGADADPLLGSLLLHDSSARRSIEYCRAAVDDLTALIDDLSVQIKSKKRPQRGVAKVKVALKRETLTKFESRLQQAVQYMTLSQQCYLVALTKIQPDLMLKRLAPFLPPQRNRRIEGEEECTEPESTNENPQVFGMQGSNQVKKWSSSSYWASNSALGVFSVDCGTEHDREHNLFPSSTYRIMFQPPVWLVRQAWDLRCTTSSNGWQFNLRSHPIVPASSQAFQLIESGDLNGLQRLFQDRNASPFDQTPDGWTLFHEALWNSRPEIFLFLLQLNVDIRRVAIHDNLTVFEWSDFRGPEEARKMALLWKQEARSLYLEYLTDSESFGGRHWDYSLPVVALLDLELFDLTVEHLEPSWYELPASDRILVFRQITSRSFIEYVDGQLPRSVLWKDGIVRREDILALHREGIPYFHWVVLTYGRQLMVEDIYDTAGWRALVRDLIPLCGDLHGSAVDEYGFGIPPNTTPFFCLLYGAINWWFYWRSHEIRDFKRDVQRAVTLWAEDLASCGVDLIQYGRQEHNHLVHQRTTMEFRHPSYGIVGIDDFKYGPNPADWLVSIDPYTEKLAGIFWKLIEDPPLDIPGSWVDDDVRFKLVSETWEE